jgi:hypothetical protein
MPLIAGPTVLRFQVGKLGHLLQPLPVVLGLVQKGLKALLLTTPVPCAKPAHPCSAISARASLIIRSI